MRRLPIYFLIDSSGGMQGEIKHIVENVLQVFFCSLRSNPEFIENVAISVIGVSSVSKLILELQTIEVINIAGIKIETLGVFNLKDGLKYLHNRIEGDVYESENPGYRDKKPLIVLLNIRNPIPKLDEKIINPKNKIGLFISYALSNEVDYQFQNELSNYGINMIDEQFEKLPFFFKWFIELIEIRLQDFTQHQMPKLPNELKFLKENL